MEPKFEGIMISSRSDQSVDQVNRNSSTAVIHDNFGDKIKEFTKTQNESETNSTEKHSSETVKYCEVSEYDSKKQGELNENDKEKHVVENNESTEIETLTMFKQNEGGITPEYMEKITTVEIGNKFEFVHPDVISSGTDDSFNDSLSTGIEKKLKTL